MKFRITDTQTTAVLHGLDGITADNGVFLLGCPKDANAPRLQDMEVDRPVRRIFTASGGRTEAYVTRTE